MINVTLGEKPKTEEKPFPKLMISETGNIVLFIDTGKGTLVGSKTFHCDAIGSYYTNWAFEDFTDYNEAITLQNQ